MTGRMVHAKCRHCGGNVGAIELTAAEEIFHSGRVLTDDERGFCSQRCRVVASSGEAEQ